MFGEKNLIKKTSFLKVNIDVQFCAMKYKYIIFLQKLEKSISFSREFIGYELSMLKYWDIEKFNMKY